MQEELMKDDLSSHSDFGEIVELVKSISTNPVYGKYF